MSLPDVTSPVDRWLSVSNIFGRFRTDVLTGGATMPRKVRKHANPPLPSLLSPPDVCLLNVV
jgi:hypothetical protein